MRVNKISWLLG